jgi:hypothetical protein
VELKLELQSPKARRSNYKVNNFYLQDKEVITAMTEVWQNLHILLKFFRKMRQLLRWYCGFYTSATKKRKAKEATLQRCLEDAHR